MTPQSLQFDIEKGLVDLLQPVTTATVYGYHGSTGNLQTPYVVCEVVEAKRSIHPMVNFFECKAQVSLTTRATPIDSETPFQEHKTYFDQVAQVLMSGTLWTALATACGVSSKFGPIGIEAIAPTVVDEKYWVSGVELTFISGV